MIIENSGPVAAVFLCHSPYTGGSTTLLQRNTMGTIRRVCRSLRLDQDSTFLVTPTAACDEAQAEVTAWTIR
ncbi:MAG: hypothetical protein WCJ87_01140 [Burkholderiales bacterium]